MQFSERCFLEAFFESGVVTAVIASLSSDFPTPDEERTYVLLLLKIISDSGKPYKLLLCHAGVVGCVFDALVDAVNWDTLKACGSLIRCEVHQIYCFRQTVIFKIFPHFVLYLSCYLGNPKVIIFADWRYHAGIHRASIARIVFFVFCYSISRFCC